MTDAAAAPAAVETATSTETNEAPESSDFFVDAKSPFLTPHDRRQRLLSRLRNGAATEPSPPQRSEAAPPPSEESGTTDDASDSPSSEGSESEAAEVAPEAAKPEKPAEKPPEKRAAADREREDREAEVRLSRLSRELRDAKADALEAKEGARQYRELNEKLTRAKGDAYAAVQLLPELLGMDFGELADFVVANESRFKEQQRYAQLPPDVREELEAAKRDRVARETREREEGERTAREARFTTYRDSATRFLDTHKEDYPLAHAIGWAPQQIARSAIDRDTRDARPLLDELEKNLRSELTGAFSNAQVLTALIRDDAALADKVRQALAAASPKKPEKSPAAASLRSGTTGATEGPSSLSNGVVASDTATSLSMREQRRRRVMEASKAWLYGGKQA